MANKMQKILIGTMITLFLVTGCTKTDNESVNTVSKTKETNNVKEQTIDNKQQEVKQEENTVYSDYVGEISNNRDSDDITKEDDEYIRTTVSTSQFFDNDFTIEEGLYSLYTDYMAKVTKTNNNKVFIITYDMDFEFDNVTEKHKMVIKADFDQYKYQLIELSVDGEKYNDKESIDNFITSLVSTSNETKQEEPVYINNNNNNQQVNNLNNKRRLILSDFNGGNFYSPKVNISNVRMMAKFDLQAKEATDNGYVFVKSTIRTNDLKLVFAKYDYYWRVVSVEKDGQEFDPAIIETIILNELG